MRHRWIRLLLLLYLPFAVFVIGGGIYTYRGEERRERERIETREAVEVDLAAKNLQSSFDVMFGDLVYLVSDEHIFGAIATRPQAGGKAAHHLKDHLVAFLKAKPGYEKLRWLDRDGMERFRIERRAGAIVNLPAAELQDKSDRHYFQYANAMNPCEIYVSPLDLQVERGVVVQPPRPLIRIAAALTGRAGHQGIAVLNYEGSALIDTFLRGFRGSSLEHAYLVDDAGRWLRSPQSADDFGFMFGETDSLGTRHPEAWQRIRQAQQGQFATAEGLWTFRHFAPVPPEVAVQGATAICAIKVDRPFVVISLVPEIEFAEAFRNALAKIGISAVLLLLVGFAGSVFLTRLWIAREGAHDRARRLDERNLLLTHLGEGVIGVDGAGRCNFANDSAARLLECPTGAMVGRPLAELIDWQADGSGAAASLDEWLANARRDGARIEQSGRLRVPSGSHVPVWLALSPLPPNEGKIAAVVTLQDITELKHAEAEAYNLAYYDALTGLPNRRMLTDRLGQSLIEQEHADSTGALAYLDIDQFKLVNEAYGKHAGDLLLIEMGHALRRSVRVGDTVAHLGADHFVILMPDLAHQAEEAARRIENDIAILFSAINAGFVVDGRRIAISISVGVSLIDGVAVGPDEILKRGELAMVEAKKQEGNHLRFFDPQMQARIEALIALQDDIRRGLIEREFVPFYQPKVDHAGRLLSVEALCRWQHPQRGLVSPAEFIPIAEESGMIVVMGFQMLEQACRQLAEWAQRPETAQLTIAVNVSSKQFALPHFVEEVLALLDALDAAPDHLVLELTESRLAENIDDFIAKMAALRRHGVRFALDDFGTGYSSLSYLRRLPVQELKIDRSFVGELPGNANDAALVRTIIAMGHSLDMKIVAEGVETPAQWEFLRRENCDLGQGYLFGKPLPVEVLERTWLG